MKVDIRIDERQRPTLLSRIGIGKGKPPLYLLAVKIVFTNEECHKIKVAGLYEFPILSIQGRKWDRESDSYVDAAPERKTLHYFITKDFKPKPNPDFYYFHESEDKEEMRRSEPIIRANLTELKERMDNYTDPRGSRSFEL